VTSSICYQEIEGFSISHNGGHSWSPGNGTANLDVLSCPTITTCFSVAELQHTATTVSFTIDRWNGPKTTSTVVYSSEPKTPSPGWLPRPSRARRRMCARPRGGDSPAHDDGRGKDVAGGAHFLAGHSQPPEPGVRAWRLLRHRLSAPRGTRRSIDDDQQWRVVDRDESPRPQTTPIPGQSRAPPGTRADSWASEPPPTPPIAKSRRAARGRSAGIASSLTSLSAVGCPTMTTCIAVGAGEAVSTDNGGESWMTAVDPPGWGPAAQLPGLCVIDDLRLSQASQVAYPDQVAAMERTTDGGQHWQPVTLPLATRAVYAATCLSATTCVVAGGGRRSDTSDDGRGGRLDHRLVSLQQRWCALHLLWLDDHLRGGWRDPAHGFNGLRVRPGLPVTSSDTPSIEGISCNVGDVVRRDCRGATSQPVRLSDLELRHEPTAARTGRCSPPPSSQTASTLPARPTRAKSWVTTPYMGSGHHVGLDILRWRHDVVQRHLRSRRPRS